MARPLRILIRDGWYHVFHRGTERREIFSEDRERRHFLDLIGELHDRYRFRIHAYSLMDNHYHGIVQTSDANLSAGMQWLHLSYAAWYNAGHQRVGPLWQGRFGSVPVENGAWAYQLSLYVHLNVVCVEELGLDKRAKRAESEGWKAPSAEEVTQRMKVLRGYRWSSYRGYAGYDKAADWLETGELLRRASRGRDEQSKRYREEVKNLLRKGAREGQEERLFDAVAIGSEAFRRKVQKIADGGTRETSGKRALRRRVEFEEVVLAVEEARGQNRTEFLCRRGDCGPALVMWLARRYCGMTLREIGEAMGGKDYAAVSDRIRRFERRLESDRSVKRGWRKAVRILNLDGVLPKSPFTRFVKEPLDWMRYLIVYVYENTYEAIRAIGRSAVAACGHDRRALSEVPTGRMRDLPEAGWTRPGVLLEHAAGWAYAHDLHCQGAS